jgi:DNA-binding LytR/AlgR family response regulator
MNLRAIIVDDESLARENLKIQLQKVDANLETLAEASNGAEALTLIEQHKPDVVFLDVQMPLMDGFAVAESLLLGDDAPEIVFITAYNQYAIRAFDVNAAHYLLKPVSKERLKLACERVVERVAAKKNAMQNETNIAPPKLSPQEAELERLMSYLKSAAAPRTDEPKLTGLAAKVRGQLLVIKLHDINHITADEKVNFIHTDSGSHITDYTLDELEARLDLSVFMRIHRSHIVNIQKVKSLVPWFGGKFKVVLNDVKQTELSLSRFRLEEMRKRLLW